MRLPDQLNARVTTVLLSFQNSFQTQKKEGILGKKGGILKGTLEKIFESSYLCNMLLSKQFACFCTIYLQLIYRPLIYLQVLQEL